MFFIRCNCGEKLRFDAEDRGTKVRCAGCKKRVMIPLKALPDKDRPRPPSASKGPDGRRAYSEATVSYRRKVEQIQINMTFKKWVLIVIPFCLVFAISCGLVGFGIYLMM